MKHEQKNSNTGNDHGSHVPLNQANKNHLYNLLYAGRITLKEYLQKVKVIAQENGDA